MVPVPSPTSFRPTGTWPVWRVICSCLNRPHREACDCRLTSSSDPWPRTNTRGRSASCFRARAVTAHWGCGPSRARGHGDGPEPRIHRVRRHAATDYRPDLMLLDIGLPELDGYEVAKRIRQEPLLHAIVVVALTGSEQEHRSAACPGSGLRSPLGQARRFRLRCDRSWQQSRRRRLDVPGARERKETGADDGELSSGSRGR